MRKNDSDDLTISEPQTDQDPIKDAAKTFEESDTNGDLFGFAKPFGYSYQDEHRFCWIPTNPSMQLSHLDIEIGSLRDFSDLIVL
jgi:hypothetical protein